MPQELIEYTALGQKKTVQKLLDAGCDVNIIDEFGLTAAIVAAKRNDLEVLNILKERGADLSLKDKMGQDALFWARQNKNHVMIELISQQHSNNKILNKNKPCHERG